MRTLDPDLPRLRQILRSRKAPIWVVQTAPLNSWDIDRGDALRTLLTHRYRRAASRRVADVCGHRPTPCFCASTSSATSLPGRTGTHAHRGG